MTNAEPAEPQPFVVVLTEPEPVSTHPRDVKAAIPSSRVRRRKRLARLAGIAGLVLAMLIVVVAYWLGTLGRSRAKFGWTTVSPPGAGFSISMPGRQHERTTYATDEQGRKIIHEIVASRAGSVIFLVDHSDLGFDIDPAKSKTFLDNYRDVHVRARSARVVKETDLATVGTLHGREFCDEFKDPEPGSKGRLLTSRTRVFVDGRRCISIHAIAPKGSSDTEAIAKADRFLQSFYRSAATPAEKAKIAAAEPPKPPVAEPPKAEVKADPPVPTPEGRSPALRYSWAPGKTAVYAVKILVDGGDRYRMTLEGHSLYRLKAAEADEFTIAYQGRFDEGKLVGVNEWSRGRMAQQPLLSKATIKMNAKGRVTSLDGRTPLPLIGDIATLILEPFPEEAKDEWEISDHFIIFTRISGDTGPIGFSRPAFRLRSELLPLNDPARRFGGQAAGDPIGGFPERRTMPAIDHTSFRLKAESGGIVSIEKRYSVQTVHRIDDKPELSITGDATIQFDRSQGLPTSVTYKAMTTRRTSNSEVRSPVSFEFHLVEGADRQKLLGMTPPPDAELAPTVDIADAELDRLVADLGKEDRKALKACRTLSDATSVPSRRSQLARALEAHLDTANPPLRFALVKALGNWGDETTIALLTRELGENRFGGTQELQDAICRLAAWRPSAMGLALAFWLGKDGMAARRLYRAMGTSAESELVQVIERSRDPRARVEACTILEQFGTKASIPALEAIGQKRSDEEIGAVATEAVRLIEARKLDERGMAKLLDALNGQRTRIDLLDSRAAACIRLVDTPRDAEKQPQIARKLEALLDDSDANTNVQAGHALVVWGDDQSSRIMFDHLASPDYRQWRPLAEDLAKMANTAETAKAIASRLRDDNHTVLQALEKMGPAAEGELIRILETEADNGVRREACRHLSKIGTSLSLPALRKAEKTQGSLVGILARQTLQTIELRQISNDEFATVLKTAETSKDPDARRRALERLVALDYDPARAPLVVAAALEAMSDPERTVQTRAIEVSQKWVRARDVHAFYEKLEEKSLDVHALAITLIKADPTAENILKVVQRLERLDQSLGWVLEAIGVENEAIALKLMEPSARKDTRVEAGRWLGRHGTDASLSGLRDIAKIQEDGKVAAAAARVVTVIREREFWQD